MPPRAIHPALRQKKGAKPSAREFVVQPLREPPLPQRYRSAEKDGVLTRTEADWHPEAVQNWHIRWGSALASEFMDVDVAALKRLLAMESEYFEGVERGKGRVTLAVEIRQVEEALGLPLTKRYSLDFTIAATESLERGATAPRRTHDITLPPSSMTELGALD